MRKNIFIFFLVIITFMFNKCTVKAEACDNIDLARLKVLANNVQISYEFLGKVTEDEDVYGKYKVVISNIDKELEIIINNRVYGINDYKDNTLSFETTTLKHEISIYPSCSEEKYLRKETLSIPMYNYFSDSEECKRLEKYNLDICKTLYDGEIDEDYFYEVFDRYTNLGSENFSIFDQIVGLVSDNLLVSLFIFGGVLCLIIILVVVIHKKRSALE